MLRFIPSTNVFCVHCFAKYHSVVLKGIYACVEEDIRYNAAVINIFALIVALPFIFIELAVVYVEVKLYKRYFIDALTTIYFIIVCFLCGKNNFKSSCKSCGGSVVSLVAL